jgi:hypothetical protein
MNTAALRAPCRGSWEDFMRPIAVGLCFAFALSVSAVLSAGQIYGTIVAENQPVKDTDVEIKCGEDAPLKGKTAADGAYRINVPKEGQCSLTLPTYAGKPSASIFSTPNPTLYNFAVVKNAEGKFELKRRQ